VIGYFDCFAGISGDMTLGALVDAGADASLLEATVEALGLASEVRISTTPEHRGHVTGTRVAVEVSGRRSRTVPALRRAVESAGVPDAVRDRALAAVDRLAAAESALHRTPESELHLHEVGGADTLVDLVGSFWLLETLDLRAVHASALPAPRGRTGGLPATAPATLRILERTGATLTPDDRDFELVTPTGAAILAVAARFDRPAMTIERTGFGLGAREEPGNALGFWMGRPAPAAATVTVLETNLDDMAPNQLAALAEDLLEIGSLDVSITPVVMKKGRPGHQLTVLAEPADAARVAGRILDSSPVLGVRATTAGRFLAGRRSIEVATKLGKAHAKVKELDGHPVDVAPEYEDCRRLARGSGVDLREVMRLVAAAARAEVGL
jgi:uncharacterized protein (TIGR00299 family) protein